MPGLYRQFISGYSKGVAVIEYAIPTALVAGAVVMALNTTNIQGMILPWFQNTVNANGAVVQSYGMSVTASVGQNPMPVDPVTGLPVLPPPNVGEEQVCFNSGLCVNIPVIPGNSVVETSATTGAWAMQIANVIDQIAQQLQAENGNSPLVEALIALANSGHEIGYTMQSLPPVGLVSQNGQGYVGVDASGIELVNGMYAIGSQDQDFMNQLDVVNSILAEDKSWAQSYPELADLVKYEAGIIHQLAQGASLSPSEQQEGPSLEGGYGNLISSGGSGLNGASGNSGLGISSQSSGLGGASGSGGSGSTSQGIGSDGMSGGIGGLQGGGGNSGLGGAGQDKTGGNTSPLTSHKAEVPAYMEPLVDAQGVQNTANNVCAMAGGGGQCTV